jgi:hypothetical protein
MVTYNSAGTFTTKGMAWSTYQTCPRLANRQQRGHLHGNRKCVGAPGNAPLCPQRSYHFATFRQKYLLTLKSTRLQPLSALNY